MVPSAHLRWQEEEGSSVRAMLTSIRLEEPVQQELIFPFLSTPSFTQISLLQIKLITVWHIKCNSVVLTVFSSIKSKLDVVEYSSQPLFLFDQY